MTVNATSLLGLALPVTGTETGTWGDTVNNALTSLLDTAVAGVTSLTTDADVTLTTTTLASNQARQAIILWAPASGTTTRNITAPAQSKTISFCNAANRARCRYACKCFRCSATGYGANYTRCHNTCERNGVRIANGAGKTGC